MSTRMKTLLLLSALTVACASCASTCSGTDDGKDKPRAVNLTGRAGAGSTVMQRPRALMAIDGMLEAGADPVAH